MRERTFHDHQALNYSGLEVPPGLLARTEELEARGEAWEVHFCGREAWTCWTLVLREAGEATQWQDGEGLEGQWVQERLAVRLDDEDHQGLYSLEGRPLPEDVWEESEGEDYQPAFGPPSVLPPDGDPPPFGADGASPFPEGL